GSVELSFYMNYFVVSMALLVIAFILVRRLERSWIGLNLDALRLDELAASCFGINIARWKIVAFTLGNLLIGMAGALFGMVGGIGNAWGVVVATCIVVIVPEKLQTIQEYRFLIYASLVIAVLLFRPEGLLPRPVRRYFPGWQR